MTAFLDAFWNRVAKAEPDTCWSWKGPTDPKGYGRLQVNGRWDYAHRVGYELLVGPIPRGLTLDHLCRNRRCVNPRHLEPISNRENILRGYSFSATNHRKTHCHRGHEFTPENTRIERQRGGRRSRRCRECAREASKAAYARIRDDLLEEEAS